jgi:uncharacterized protein
VRKGRWFLPETPDLLGQLRAQLAITQEGLNAFASWAAGDEAAGETLSGIEHRADAAKRELLNALREAFITPLEPEDLFALSRGIDWILDHARDLVSEAKAMKYRPDRRLAEMAELLREAVGHIAEAIDKLGVDSAGASAAADEAIRTERRMEHAYYEGMGELLEVEERQERISSRELYRGCARIGDHVIDVAERIVYSGVKET